MIPNKPLEKVLKPGQMRQTRQCSFSTSSLGKVGGEVIDPDNLCLIQPVHRGWRRQGGQVHRGWRQGGTGSHSPCLRRDVNRAQGTGLAQSSLNLMMPFYRTLSVS